MREVAERAGVAVSSVSRVLGGHPNVSDAMRRRVLGAVEELGYVPDVLAQSLRRGVSMTVGLLVSDIANPLFAEIAMAAERRLRDAGHVMLILNSHGTTDGDAGQLDLLIRRRVDGLILSPSDEGDAALVERLRQFDRPIVLLDRELAGVDASHVLSDHAGGIEDTVDYLTELGHTRIGLVGGNPAVRPTRERAAALRRACEARGATAVVDWGAYTADHGFAATQRLLGEAVPPSALIAGGNQILVGVLRALRARRLRIGRDVSLVTCDRVALAEFLDPPLATIVRDTASMGGVAGDLLLRAMSGEPPSDVLLPTTFAPERSCGVRTPG
jgi:LacI family transcriptional regulator